MFAISAEEAKAIKEQIEKEVIAHESTELDFGGNMDFKVHFTEAYFTTDANYNKGQTVILKLVGENLETGEEIKQYWSLGKDAEALDNGNRVQFPNGKKSYHVSSTIGTIIHKIKEGEYGLNCAMDLLPKDVTLAETWIDTCWQVKPVEFEYKEGDKVRKQVRAFPVEYLGRKKLEQKTQVQHQQMQVNAGFTQNQMAMPQNQNQQQFAAQVPQQMMGNFGQVAQQFAGQMPQQAQQVAQVAQQATQQAQQVAQGLVAHLNPVSQQNLRVLALSNPNEVFISQAGNFAPEIFTNPVLANGLISGQLYAELKSMA